jgi:hypothetical protein
VRSGTVARLSGAHVIGAVRLSAGSGTERNPRLESHPPAVPRFRLRVNRAVSLERLVGSSLSSEAILRATAGVALARAASMSRN